MAFRDDLTHCWDLGEASGNRLDSIGTRHLTPVGAPGNTTGKVGDAVDLVRSSSQCLSNASGSPFTQSAAYSLAFWFYLTSIPSPGNMTLFSVANGLSAGQYDFFGIILGASSKLQIAFGAGFGGVITHNTVITTAGWHFVGITHSSTALRLKVDSEAWDSVSSGFGSSGAGAPFNIGATNSTANFLDGYVDSFMVWNVAKSDSDIVDAWNSGNGASCIQPPMPADLRGQLIGLLPGIGRFAGFSGAGVAAGDIRGQLYGMLPGIGRMGAVPATPETGAGDLRSLIMSLSFGYFLIGGSMGTTDDSAGPLHGGSYRPVWRPRRRSF